MTAKYVDLEALNIRSEPTIHPSTRIGILHLGQRIDQQGPTDRAGWIRIKADIEGVPREGVVIGEIDGRLSLREPVTEARETLVAEAIKEWMRFKKGLGIEHHEPFFKFVGEMWRSIGLNLDGKDRDTPWFAAAISWRSPRSIPLQALTVHPQQRSPRGASCIAVSSAANGWA